MSTKALSLQMEKILQSKNLNKYNHFLMGFKNNTPNWVNIAHNPNSLYVGAMGSGKSVGCYSSIFHYSITNPDDLIIIVDILKSAHDYSNLFSLPLVLPVINDSNNFFQILDLIYSEASLRKKYLESNNLDSIHSSPKVFSNIHLVIEEAFAVFKLVKMENFNHPDSEKFFYLLKNGRRLGITITCVSQILSQKHMDASYLNYFDNKIVFKAEKEDAEFLNSLESYSISTSERGAAFNQDGYKVFYPYIDNNLSEQFIRPYSSYSPSLVGLSLSELDIAHFKQDLSLLSAKLASKEFWDFIENH